MELWTTRSARSDVRDQHRLANTTRSPAAQAPKATTLTLSGDDILSWYEALPAHIADANIAAIVACQERDGAGASPGPAIEKWYRQMDEDFAATLEVIIYNLVLSPLSLPLPPPAPL